MKIGVKLKPTELVYPSHESGIKTQLNQIDNKLTNKENEVDLFNANLLFHIKDEVFINNFPTFCEEIDQTIKDFYNIIKNERNFNSDIDAICKKIDHLRTKIKIANELINPPALPITLDLQKLRTNVNHVKISRASLKRTGELL